MEATGKYLHRPLQEGDKEMKVTFPDGIPSTRTLKEKLELDGTDKMTLDANIVVVWIPDSFFDRLKIFLSLLKLVAVT